MADTQNETIQPTDPAGSDLATGAADMATDTVQGTALEGGMKVITTPQGKASVDKNAPPLVTDAFQSAADQAAASPSAAPLYDESGKRIVGLTSLRANPKNAAKGSYAVANSMITTRAGAHYVAGDIVGPKDLTQDDLDVLTSGDNPAIVPLDSVK